MSAKNQSKTVLAIDAGFGMMKFSRRDKTSGEIVFDNFPSAAVDVPPSTTQDSLDSVGASRDVVMVTSGGREFMVGHDVRAEMIGNDFGRDMTDTYYDSDVYHALMRGALHYMDEATIHTLCLGLPMNHHMAAGRVEKLISAYTGEIQISATKKVTIENVIVQPQPFGAYVNLGKRVSDLNKVLEDANMPIIEKPSDLSNMTILIVDPGEYTLDWLLMQNGSPITKASNAVGDSGRHRVIRQVHQLVQTKLGRPLGTSFYADIDACLRAGKKLRVAGEFFDLQETEYQDLIKRTIDDPIRQLFEGLRGADDRIDLAVVMGGWPGDVADAIKRAKPWMAVFAGKPDDGKKSSIYSNLSGFQIWAEQKSKEF